MSWHRRILQARRSRERGAALLETAIVAPLLILLLFGIIQYGQLLGAHIALRNAASVAARAAVLDSATPAGIRNAARDALVYPLQPADLPDGNISITNPMVNGQAATQVTLTYAFPIMASFVVPGSSGGALTITASATMR